uniref:Protein phosphatase 1 regulatory subunit 21 n=1 Tax=Syphacia muris TaxID=451379 RepID=A0A0N5AHH8_9BILA
LKSQIPVLKNAFFDEQSKNRSLTEELQAKVANMRKLESEMESLEFRNEQLLKRVESLQIEVDAAQKLPFKYKKADDDSHNTSSLNCDGDIDIIKDEFEIKIQENQFLYSKIEEMKLDFEAKLQAFKERCAELEAQLASAKGNVVDISSKKSGPSQMEKIEIDAEVCENSPSSSVDRKTIVLASDDINGTFHAILNDSIQKVHVFIQGFINLLRLLEQRSTVYPNDMVLETLPENTLLFGQRVLKTIGTLKDLCSMTENLCTKVADDECELDFSSEVADFSSAFSEVVKSFQCWSEPFKQYVELENKVSWCGINLCTSNEVWCKNFLKFLGSLHNVNKVLLELGEGAAENCINKLNESLQLLSELSKLYNQKIFDENRLPTASKRLKCLNDCIGKCIASMERNLENFILLLKLAVSSYSLKCNSATDVANEKNDIDLEVEPNSCHVDDDSTLCEMSEKGGDDIGESNNSTLIPRLNDLESELSASKSRIVDLEKERDRLQVETELLKMKLSGGGTETFETGSLLHTPSEELRLVIEFYEKRVEELAKEVQYLQGRASYYQNECVALLQHAQLSESEKDALAEELLTTKEKVSRLKDDLDTTQKGYEEQMKKLCEHMSELNAKIESQSETILSLKTNGIGGIKQGARKLLFK